MKSQFIVKVLFLLAVVALSPALRKMEIRAQTSPTSKQDHPEHRNKPRSS